MICKNTKFCSPKDTSQERYNMRDLTVEEQRLVAGANNDLPVSLETAGGLVGGAIGAARGGHVGGAIGTFAGAAVGRWAQENAQALGTIDPVTLHLPMNGVRPNYQYGGGFS